MHKNIEEQELNSTQCFMLAYQTCQWWNVVFIQAKRFFDILEKEHGGTPWDDGKNTNSMFVGERMFLILAIQHAIENLQKLDVEIQREGDMTLKNVISAIQEVAPLQDIKNLRDMNEHYLDYLANKGYKQKEYQSSVEINGHEILTSAAWTQVRGDVDAILLGNVEIDKLIIKMKEQLPIVQEKTKEIFEKKLTE
ncbi:MAG: hypothetical protein IJ147_03005 [Lachnospiraceae bacterium]|nr:hypothetical protein [Lachnospiraceae bacterium]